MAIDYGDKRVGLAITDETGTLAIPHSVIANTSREESAKEIASLCRQARAETVLIGMSYDEDGQPTFTGRKVLRFIEVLKTMIDARIELWDEHLTTQEAVTMGVRSGIAKHKRTAHMDHLAATILLREYLERNEK